MTNSLEVGKPLHDTREKDLENTLTGPRAAKNISVITDRQKAFLGGT